MDFLMDESQGQTASTGVNRGMTGDMMKRNESEMNFERKVGRGGEATSQGQDCEHVISQRSLGKSKSESDNISSLQRFPSTDCSGHDRIGPSLSAAGEDFTGSFLNLDEIRGMSNDILLPSTSLDQSLEEAMATGNRNEQDRTSSGDFLVSALTHNVDQLGHGRVVSPLPQLDMAFQKVDPISSLLRDHRPATQPPTFSAVVRGDARSGASRRLVDPNVSDFNKTLETMTRSHQSYQQYDGNRPVSNTNYSKQMNAYAGGSISQKTAHQRTTASDIRHIEASKTFQHPRKIDNHPKNVRIYEQNLNGSHQQSLPSNIESLRTGSLTGHPQGLPPHISNHQIEPNRVSYVSAQTASIPYPSTSHIERQQHPHDSQQQEQKELQQLHQPTQQQPHTQQQIPHEIACLKELLTVVNKLDPPTQISIRDSLLRLSHSAEMRRTSSQQGKKRSSKSGSKHNKATDMIDRSVAQLLYNRLDGEGTVNLANGQTFNGQLNRGGKGLH